MRRLGVKTPSKRALRKLTIQQSDAITLLMNKLLRLEKTAGVNQTGEFTGSTIISDFVPNSVGVVSSEGVSEYVSRADHVHADAAGAAELITTTDAAMDNGEGDIGSIGLSRYEAADGDIPWLKIGAAEWQASPHTFTTLHTDARAGDLSVYLDLAWYYIDGGWIKIKRHHTTLTPTPVSQDGDTASVGGIGYQYVGSTWYKTTHIG